LALGPRTGGARLRAAVLFVACLTNPMAASAEEILRNWFNDPFFQVRSAIADCPVPLGPYGTEADRMRETHYRSERGLRCYLEKKCTRPSSYMYDADIAAAVKARFEKSPLLRQSTLWVTAQRRFVWVEGCAASPTAAKQIEKLLAGVPDLERTIVFVSRDRKSPPPYRIAGPNQRRVD
jgi:hypothetical protein